jgi:cytoskeletal protein RodZ
MAPTIGQTLRNARADRGVELSEVEQATKIRVKFLEAMEDDRWDAMPAPAYARGFLEIYARYLGLDRIALLEEYSETVEGERGPEEPIPGSVIKPGTLRQNRPVRRAGSIRKAGSIKWGPVGKVLAGLVALAIVGLIIVGSIGGSDNGGDNGKQKKAPANGANAAGSAARTQTTTSTTPSDRVSVELRASATVWVCLVDDGGNPRVDGETLSTDEQRGPFSAGGFDVTFGNGSVEMTVDGETQQVPAVAEPIGYRITPTGVRRLDASSRPTCT